MEQKKTSGSMLLTVILVGLAALLSVTILVVILLQHFRPDTETPSSGVSVSTEAVPTTETALETEGPAVTEGTAETTCQHHDHHHLRKIPRLVIKSRRL